MKNTLHRIGLLLLIVIGLAATTIAQSTQMTIHLNDGTERTYSMSENDHVYFEDNQTLVVEALDKAKTDRFNLADIRKITCSEFDGISEENDQNPVIFPNPVLGSFSLRNLNSKETIHVYALDGRLVKSVEVSGDQPIDVSDLSFGVYLVKTQSQTLKMIKL